MIDTPAGVFLEEISSAFLGWTDIRERGEAQEDVVRARGATLPGIRMVRRRAATLHSTPSIRPQFGETAGRIQVKSCSVSKRDVIDRYGN